MSTTARPRLRPRLRGRVRRPGRRTLLVLVVLAGVLAGAFFWVRSSSLLAVQTVTVTGVSGPDAAAIRATLVRTAEGMSTIDLDRGRLERSVSRYRFVRRLDLNAHLPHGLTIEVAEQVPVAVLVGAGGRTTVSGDGTLLRGTRPSAALPAIRVTGQLGARRVGGETLTEVRLLAAAPYAFISRIASAGRSGGGRGLTVTLRDGPAVYFGDATRLGAKWRAVVSVLADSSSAGAAYIDVTDPARPAAGSGSDTTEAGDTATTSTSTTG